MLKDKSGQGNDARQDTNASQPEFVKNALGTSGDMPILRFDGSDDFLNLMKLIRSEPFLWWLIGTLVIRAFSSAIQLLTPSIPELIRYGLRHGLILLF